MNQQKVTSALVDSIYYIEDKKGAVSQFLSYCISIPINFHSKLFPDFQPNLARASMASQAYIRIPL